MKPVHRRRLALVLGLTLYFIVLWVLWPSAAVYPLKIFVVFLHEMSHALAALATGGQVESISLDWREGGVTRVRGGNAFLMLSAGYLGSLLFGLLFLELAGRSPRKARNALLALGVFVVIATLGLVRGAFGFVFGLAFGGVLIFAARRLSDDAAVMVLTALGITSALYAVLDIRSDILQRPGIQSDAFMLAELTGIPVLFWGVLWGGVALLACAWMLRRMWRRA
ncbi:MAG: M50 family metallopeptidase [Gemmatimonadota bacterium]